ncbi:TPA: fimbrial protein [Providencia alcalifaciens]|uniref:Fimbrial protein n=1 Tax=Providencia alcalifaciens TaxID=126385 RepID=A0AAW9VEI1_9GAMM|nr:fimbrial protein [Providencia alcalifaciens]EKT62354.1 fimbrial subunit [Providencia alcalifaciens Dmel2]MTC35829.1 fimbrial protein [Providencia alcalifaciens]
MEISSKLKKNILASALIISCSLLSNISMANAYDGKITFLGKISNATCEISGGTGGQETASPNFTVNLPQVSTSAFKQINDRAGDTEFFIKLKGSNCAAGDGYAIKFEKISSVAFIDPVTGFLKNLRSSGAQNVQLVLSEDGQDINFNEKDTSKSKNRSDKDTETVFNFGVQYVATKANVTSGDVEGNIYYSVVYP